MQERDRNTKKFHLMASTKRKGNIIDKLNVQGKLVDKPEVLKDVIATHFESHFSKNQSILLKDWICNFSMLNQESTRLLERPFFEEEVWDVIQRCDGNKPHGPDGFNMHFFKSQWSLIKNDVMGCLKNSSHNTYLITS